MIIKKRTSAFLVCGRSHARLSTDREKHTRTHIYSTLFVIWWSRFVHVIRPRSLSRKTVNTATRGVAAGVNALRTRRGTCLIYAKRILFVASSSTSVPSGSAKSNESRRVRTIRVRENPSKTFASRDTGAGGGGVGERSCRFRRVPPCAELRTRQRPSHGNVKTVNTGDVPFCPRVSYFVLILNVRVYYNNNNTACDDIIADGRGTGNIGRFSLPTHTTHHYIIKFKKQMFFIGFFVPELNMYPLIRYADKHLLFVLNYSCRPRT